MLALRARRGFSHEPEGMDRVFCATSGATLPAKQRQRQKISSRGSQMTVTEIELRWSVTQTAAKVGWRFHQRETPETTPLAQDLAKTMARSRDGTSDVRLRHSLAPVGSGHDELMDVPARAVASAGSIGRRLCRSCVQLRRSGHDLISPATTQTRSWLPLFRRRAPRIVGCRREPPAAT